MLAAAPACRYGRAIGICSGGSIRLAVTAFKFQLGRFLIKHQELLGHKHVETTMIYTHVLNRGGSGVVSPLD
jgi:integrase